MRTRAIASVAARVLVAILATTAAVALIVACPEFAGKTRHMLGLGFAGLPATPATALGIFGHNAAIAATPLLAALYVPRMGPRLRVALTVVLATALGVNVIVVGAALGAYGPTAVAALAPHVSFEFAAFALVAGAYMQACRHAVAAGPLLATSAAAGALLAVASLLEVFVSPIGRTR